MEYTYKYINSALPLTPESQAGLKDQYIELFQETLNNEFYNATDIWTVQEETSNGSEKYTSFDVRITHVINAETGLKLGDDWKTVLFKDISHELELGRRYLFDNNTWLTTNTEKIKNLAGSCTIRRCNNTLRWIDESTGAYYEEPCAMEYLVKEPRDYFTSGSPFTTPGGFVKIYCQFNQNSGKIRENQRFLFGNPDHWTCYKVIGTGINDFKNDQTYDVNSPKILTLDMIANFINKELDDITKGIADVNTNLYSVVLNKDSIEGAVGGTIQLSASVTYNGNSTTRPLTWISSDITVATVSSTGLVTFVKNGTCQITVNIEDNPASDTCNVTVKHTPAVNNYILVSPDENYILEDETKTYTVYLYKNNAVQTDIFTFACGANSVPAANYAFTAIDDNSFSVKNVLRCVDSYLTITCTSGTNVKTMNIYLRGAWLNDSAPAA
jgi:hypothetical protein